MEEEEEEDSFLLIWLHSVRLWLFSCQRFGALLTDSAISWADWLTCWLGLAVVVLVSSFTYTQRLIESYSHALWLCSLLGCGCWKMLASLLVVVVYYIRGRKKEQVEQSRKMEWVLLLLLLTRLHVRSQIDCGWLMFHMPYYTYEKWQFLLLSIWYVRAINL